MRGGGMGGEGFLGFVESDEGRHDLELDGLVF